MGEKTSIGWTTHTFNAWWGCHKVSPACKNCYAESFAKRTGHGVWGASAPRRFFGDKHWAEPTKWNAAAQKAGERRRVFCGSMMDVFEIHPSPIESGMQLVARTRLWQLIDSTPWLDWLLLTKRPENAEAVLPLEWWRNGCPPNVWIGTTVENQEYADLRIPHLLKIPARVRFLSCEPLLGPVDLSIPLQLDRCVNVGPAPDRFRCGLPQGHDGNHHALIESSASWFGADRIDWVIAGGESGAHHREHRLEWSRSLRDQCKAASVAYFCKQLGEHATEFDDDGRRRRLRLAPRSKGESLEELPPDLRIREFPHAVP